MQADPKYGFVKAATYGRRILVCIETNKYSSSDQQKVDINFNYIFTNGSLGLDKSQSSMFKNCNIKVFAICGSSNDAAQLSISANDPDNLKNTLVNYLNNYDNTMLLPIQINMSDLNGIPKLAQLSGDVPYVKCFNTTEYFKVAVKSVSMKDGPRSSYLMWGSFWINGYDNNGKEIADVRKRNPQINVANSQNFINVGKQLPYVFSGDLNREFVMDTRDPNAKIVFLTALDDNGDIKDSEQKKACTLYLKDIMDAIAKGNDLSYTIEGGGFSIEIAFNISK